MTKEFYTNMVEGLSYNEQIQKLKNIYTTVKLSNEPYSQSTEAICEILANDYSIFDYQIKLAEEYYMNDNFQKAIAYVDSFLNEQRFDGEKNPNLDTMLLYRAASYQALGNTLQAINGYEILHTRIASNPLNWNETGELCDEKKSLVWSCYYNKGELYFGMNDFKSSFKSFSEAWKNKPHAGCAVFLGMMLYSGQGTKKDVCSAEEYFNKAIASEDISINQSAVAHYYLGCIYAVQEEYKDKDKARLYLNKAQKQGYDISDSQIETLVAIAGQKKKTFFGLFGKK